MPFIGNVNFPIAITIILLCYLPSIIQQSVLFFTIQTMSMLGFSHAILVMKCGGLMYAFIIEITFHLWPLLVFYNYYRILDTHIGWTSPQKLEKMAQSFSSPINH